MRLPFPASRHAFQARQAPPQILLTSPNARATAPTDSHRKAAAAPSSLKPAVGYLGQTGWRLFAGVTGKGLRKLKCSYNSLPQPTQLSTTRTIYPRTLTARHHLVLLCSLHCTELTGSLRLRHVVGPVTGHHHHTITPAQPRLPIRHQDSPFTLSVVCPNLSLPLPRSPSLAFKCDPDPDLSPTHPRALAPARFPSKTF